MFIDEKQSWIRENKLAMFFTAVKPRREWEVSTGARAVHLPFGVNVDVFRDLGKTRIHDVGFSGLVHGDDLHDPVQVRERMISVMNSMADVRFYHSEGYKTAEREYARHLNSAKIWLSTPGPLHYVGTRYLEAMASGALLVCSSIPSVAGWEHFEDAYEGFLEDGLNCVIVHCDLSDFEEKIRYWLQSDSERRRIIDKARRTAQTHTWDKRAAAFTEHVRLVI
ncbi:glycosyltransferase [Gammaproteobacteria bacterium]|nr:glycosyltransferase [Gammaproteobacteria bacterium]